MLDLTNSLPVAAFFAVTYKQGDGFYPMEEQDKPGVLYFINSEFIMNQLNAEPKIIPVGWQIFRRPGEQRAFGIDLPNHEDFNNLPGVLGFKFYHDKKISEKILNVFQGGVKLFPHDPFAEKAARIKDGKVFSSQSFENVLTEYKDNFSKEEMLKKLQGKGIQIKVNAGWDYTFAEIDEIKKIIASGAIDRGRVATARLMYRPKPN